MSAAPAAVVLCRAMLCYADNGGSNVGLVPGALLLYQKRWLASLCRAVGTRELDSLACADARACLM